MDKVTIKTVPTNHTQPFRRERRAEAVSIRGPSAYQPNALPLGQTGSPDTLFAFGRVSFNPCRPLSASSELPMHGCAAHYPSVGAGKTTALRSPLWLARQIEVIKCH